MESALYTYLCKVYELLEERSTVDESGERTFVGSLKELFNETGASTTYYTPIRRLLDSPHDDPCITIYQRGNSNQESVIRLNHSPPEEWQKIFVRDLTGGRESATILVRMEREVEALIAWRESLGEVNIAKALVNFEKRLRALEAKSKTGDKNSGTKQT
jgi:hypothetical protein